MLRRIPYRLRKSIDSHPSGALIRAVAMEEFLDGINHSHPYLPIAEAAGEAMEQVKKLVDTLTAASVSPPPPLPSLPPSDKGAALGTIFDGIKPPSVPQPAAQPPIPVARQAPIVIERQAPIVVAGGRAPQAPMVSVAPTLGLGRSPVVMSQKRGGPSEAQRKAVLQLLAGGELACIATEFAVDPAELVRWRDDFLEAGFAAFGAEGEVTVTQLKSKLAEVLETAKTLEIALDRALTKSAEMQSNSLLADIADGRGRV